MSVIRTPSISTRKMHLTRHFRFTGPRGLAAGASLVNLQATTVFQAVWGFPAALRWPRHERWRRSSVRDAKSLAALRKALLALPKGTSQGAAPAPAHIYLAPSHVKALNPDVQLVTGMRGAGKTFWWSALQDGAVRQLVGRAVKWPPLNENTEVRTGLGSEQAPDDYPGRDHLRHLMGDFEATAVWRAVLAWQLAPHEDHPLRECDSWATRTHYVAKNPDAVDRLFQERDAEFDERGVYFLVLFDGLDRFAHDWKEMYGTIRGLPANGAGIALVQAPTGEGLSAVGAGGQRPDCRIRGRIRSRSLGEPELAPARSVRSAVASPRQRA